MEYRKFPSSPLDAEAIRNDGSGLGGIDAPHFAPTRPGVEQPFERAQILRRALRVDLDRTIVHIAHPTGQIERGCMAFDEGAETHALHASMDAIEPGNGASFHSPRIAATALHLP